VLNKLVTYVSLPGIHPSNWITEDINIGIIVINPDPIVYRGHAILKGNDKVVAVSIAQLVRRYSVKACRSKGRSIYGSGSYNFGRRRDWCLNKSGYWSGGPNDKTNRAYDRSRH
jgi:hypothetical protein